MPLTRHHQPPTQPIAPLSSHQSPDLTVGLSLPRQCPDPPRDDPPTPDGPHPQN